MKRALRGVVKMPPSKSESNRALMIACYGGFSPDIVNISEAHDTLLLQQLLHQVNGCQGAEPMLVDCEDAGTVARFMLTYLAGKPGSWRMTGTERLCQRPMGPLVDALRKLGADIVCEGEEGFLPMKVRGRQLTGGALYMDASKSSQFASSLLLAAPMWRDGLTLHCEGNIVSRPYIDLTINMMRRFGAQVYTENMRSITVKPIPYREASFRVGGDWTASSYWYELAAMSDTCDLLLHHLEMNTCQGDLRVRELFALLGVQTIPDKNGIRIIKQKDFHLPNQQGPLVFDFTPCPDLFPAVFVACVSNNYPSVFQGVANLSLKESDRVGSLVAELSKLYTLLYNRTSDVLILNKSCLDLDKINDNDVIISTYHDHRIAMSLAPIALVLGKSLRFDNPQVVNKSYPSYWVDFQSIIESNL